MTTGLSTGFEHRIIQDEKISFQSLGLLVAIVVAQHQEYGEIDIDMLCRQRGCSADQEAIMLGELEAAGYLKRENPSDEGLWRPTEKVGSVTRISP